MSESSSGGCDIAATAGNVVVSRQLLDHSTIAVTEIATGLEVEATVADLVNDDLAVLFGAEPRYSRARMPVRTVGLSWLERTRRSVGSMLRAVAGWVWPDEGDADGWE